LSKVEPSSELVVRPAFAATSRVKPVCRFLLTLDLHDGNSNLPRNLSATLESVDPTLTPLTLFVPAVLTRTPQVLRVLLSSLQMGHDIACHGLSHDVHDDYVGAPLERQRRTIELAKDMMESSLQVPIRAFRAPRFRVSNTTLIALEETGFSADLSVTPQRLGLLSSQPSNIGWLRAPRSPYHPSWENAFRRGTMRIWEIPTTAFLLPLTSMVYQAFGVRVLQWFASALIAEARLSGAPVVYVGHPEEFHPNGIVRHKVERRARDLIPRAGKGFRARHWFYERDGSRVCEMNRVVCDGFRGRPSVTFETVSQCLRRLGTEIGPHAVAGPAS
jgi:Uncharacterized protein conserved in bacteria (DUF2334)